MKQNEKFIQNKEFLTKLIKPITEKNKDLKFDINTSKFSKSLYLFVTQKSTFAVLRISDHKIYKQVFTNEIIINEKTKCKIIMNKVTILVKNFRFKRTFYLLKTLSKGDINEQQREQYKLKNSR